MKKTIWEDRTCNMQKKTQQTKGFGITEKRLIAACIFLSAAGILNVLAGTIEEFGEWYAGHIYPAFVFLFAHLTGRLPFSVSEIGIYGIVGMAIVTAVSAVIRGKQTGRTGAAILKWASGIFLTASILFLLYAVNCGINYRRISFSEKEGLVTEKFSVEELQEVCGWLTEEINVRTDLVDRDENGVMKLGNAAGEDAVRAMEGLAEQYGSMKGFYPLPKELLVSEILSYQNLTGIYLPFTVEANYNGDMTDYNIPFTMCHELSHLRGFMQEEEANFIAFLACEMSEKPEFQYSGYLMAWIYSTNALYRTDREMWSEVRGKLDVKVNADLQANSAFWDSYDGAVAEVADKVNDTYLKVNGQTDGVKSYDRMVDLLAAYYDNDR